MKSIIFADDGISLDVVKFQIFPKSSIEFIEGIFVTIPISGMGTTLK